MVTSGSYTGHNVLSETPQLRPPRPAPPGAAGGPQAVLWTAPSGCIQYLTRGTMPHVRHHLAPTNTGTSNVGLAVPCEPLNTSSTQRHLVLGHQTWDWPFHVTTQYHLELEGPPGTSLDYTIWVIQCPAWGMMPRVRHHPAPPCVGTSPSTKSLSWDKGRNVGLAIPCEIIQHWTVRSIQLDNQSRPVLDGLNQLDDLGHPARDDPIHSVLS